MRDVDRVVLTVVIFMLLSVVVAAAVNPPCDVEALFSPTDEIAPRIERELVAAQTSIHCSLFGLSHPELAGTLAQAAQRGVDVKIGLDRNQASLTSDLHGYLTDHGVKVARKKAWAFEHNKWCAIDEHVVIEGSWNWSMSAQRQDNSLLILTNCPVAAERFQAAFAHIWARDTAK